MPRLRTPHTLLPDLNTEKEKDILQYIPAVQKIEGTSPSVWLNLILLVYVIPVVFPEDSVTWSLISPFLFFIVWTFT